MRRALAFGTLVAAAGLGLVATAGPAFATTYCTGTITSQVNGHLEVPAGKNCGLNGATVTGNVLVDPGASLTASNATINGSVTANQPSLVVIVGGSHVGGNVTITGLTGPGGFCQSTLGGSLTVQNSGPDSAFLAGVGTVTGRRTFSSCAAPGDTIAGNVSFQNNQGAFGLNGNHVNGSVQAIGNIGGGTINNNTIGANLACGNNNPPVTANGDTVGGHNTCPT